MKKRKLPSILLILLIFSLIITACTSSKRPNPQNNTQLRQGMEENMNTNPNVNNQTTEGGVHNSAPGTNNTRTNIMPNVPNPTTPGSTAGFTLDQINKFELEVNLTNKDKIDMKYKKGPSNAESKIENRINGKTEKSTHAEASREIEKLITKIPGASISDTNRIIEGTLSALKIKREDVVEFDMEFIFETGEKVHIELNKK